MSPQSQAVAFEEVRHLPVHQWTDPTWDEVVAAVAEQETLVRQRLAAYGGQGASSRDVLTRVLAVTWERIDRWRANRQAPLGAFVRGIALREIEVFRRQEIPKAGGLAIGADVTELALEDTLAATDVVEQVSPALAAGRAALTALHAQVLAEPDGHAKWEAMKRRARRTARGQLRDAVAAYVAEQEARGSGGSGGIA